MLRNDVKAAPNSDPTVKDALYIDISVAEREREKHDVYYKNP